MTCTSFQTLRKRRRTHSNRPSATSATAVDAIQLAALPASEREILLLREWDERPGEETAAALGLSLAAMKSRLHRARLHLAALLRETRRNTSA